jgi:hypothetical protein
VLLRTIEIDVRTGNDDGAFRGGDETDDCVHVVSIYIRRRHADVSHIDVGVVEQDVEREVEEPGAARWCQRVLGSGDHLCGDRLGRSHRLRRSKGVDERDVVELLE